MSTPRRFARPQRQSPVARARPRHGLSTPIARTIAAPANRTNPTHPPVPAPVTQVDPYDDYGRHLTDEGGILMVYKDIDARFRHMLWRLFAWSTSTGAEALYLRDYALLHGNGAAVICFITVAIVNLLIVAKPVEIYRGLEVRPDRIVLDGADVFWAQHMETWPSFRANSEGHQVLSGTYGTRFVEFLTVRRFDEFDRAPEVFAAHLQQAMTQLWQRPPL